MAIDRAAYFWREACAYSSSKTTPISIVSSTALADAGYVVDRAFDGEEGHFLGDTEPYDAVVLDIGLPKMDGICVLERWRRAAARCRC